MPEISLRSSGRELSLLAFAFSTKSALSQTFSLPAFPKIILEFRIWSCFFSRCENGMLSYPRLVEVVTLNVWKYLQFHVFDAVENGYLPWEWERLPIVCLTFSVFNCRKTANVFLRRLRAGFYAKIVVVCFREGVTVWREEIDVIAWNMRWKFEIGLLLSKREASAESLQCAT